MNLSSIHNVVDLCQALVRIPSENPSGSTASHGEEAIARFVGEFLESLGARVEFEEIGPGDRMCTVSGLSHQEHTNVSCSRPIWTP